MMGPESPASSVASPPRPADRSNEIWVCVRTRACGWSGRQDMLVQEPHPRLRDATQGTCPGCGGHVFYVRDAAPQGGEVTA